MLQLCYLSKIKLKLLKKVKKINRLTDLLTHVFSIMNFSNEIITYLITTLILNFWKLIISGYWLLGVYYFFLFFFHMFLKNSSINFFFFKIGWWIYTSSTNLLRINKKSVHLIQKFSPIIKSYSKNRNMFDAIFPLPINLLISFGIYSISKKSNYYITALCFK